MVLIQMSAPGLKELLIGVKKYGLIILNDGLYPIKSLNR